MTLNLPTKYLATPGNYSRDLLSDWRWLIGERAEILAVTNFGDVFLKEDDIKFLEVGTGAVRQLAITLQQVNFKFDDEEFLDGLLLTGFQEELFSKGLKPIAGEVFGLKVLPIFSEGRYSAENIYLATLDEYISFTGHTIHSLKDFPDGTKVKLSVTD